MFRSLSRSNLRRSQSINAFVNALRQANIKPTHNFIFTAVAKAFGISVSQVEEYALTGAHLSQVNQFLAADGPWKLMFYFQPLETGAADDDADESAGGPSKRSGAPTLRITDGKDEPLRGKAIYFLRMRQVELTEANIATEVVTGRISGGVGLLSSLQETIEHVMLPALSAQGMWGELPNDSDKIEAFLEALDKFVTMLAQVMSSLAQGVTLRLKALPIENKPSAFAEAALSPELVAECEELVDDWCKKIDLVLAESEVVRRESDSVGPNKELEHWKARMAKFNTITDQLKHETVKVVIGTLTAAKSKKLEVWKTLDNRITDAANEAKDNVKYLYTLERFSEPLYKSDPVQMVEAIPGLINAIKMMHSIARYYNTSERMTALFVKITNQMITCCKEYIRGDGEIWEQDRSTLIGKLQACLALKKAYQDAFRQTKTRLRSQPKDKQFDFSEMYIFGKFELFCKRVKKLIDTFIIIEQFSALENCSIEGMGEILERFNTIVAELRNKQYDLLDHRKLEFEADFVLFYEKIVDLERLLQEFINAAFEPITSTQRALSLLRQFQSVLLMDSLRAELENKYLLIFANYGRELDVVRRLYEKQANAPPIPRDTPPVAGAISWARQLLRRIEEPMKLFQAHPHILYTLEAKKVIRVYNKLARALVEFETLYHESWMNSVEEVKYALNATLLVRNPGAKSVILVNFDSLIPKLIRETKAMQRMELEVPETAKLITMQEAKFKAHYNNLQYMLEEYSRVRSKIPKKFAQLIGPHVELVKSRIEPGLVSLTWTSLNIDGYLAAIHESLAHLEDLVDKINDIIACRVDSTLASIRATRLIDLPSESSITIEAFADAAEETTRSRAASLDSKVVLVESAVQDLVALITRGYTSSDMAKVEGFIDRVAQEYANATFEAIVEAVKASMELIKSRLVGSSSDGNTSPEADADGTGADGGAGSAGPSSGMSGAKTVSGSGSGVASDGSVPLFKLSVELEVPELVLTPSLEALQQYIDVVVEKIKVASALIYTWGQERPTKRKGASGGAGELGEGAGDEESAGNRTLNTSLTGSVIGSPGGLAASFVGSLAGGDDAGGDDAGVLRNYYESIENHKEILKLQRELAAVTSQLKSRVKADLSRFSKYAFLWSEDRNATYERFLASTPGIEAFENELGRYEGLRREIEDLAAVVVIGAVALDYGELKRALSSEAVGWKQFYGDNLKIKSHQEMNELVAFFDESTVKLNRQLNDLDDIRAVMDVLAELRKEETSISMKITPIEETYSLLNHYSIRYSKEEADAADNLRYSWKKLKMGLAIAKQAELSKLQPKFKKELLRSVEAFEDDVDEFVADYTLNGPMVRGISPRVAVERLKAFQRLFEERERKMTTYQGGEVLFGLPVHEYPKLVKIRKELRLLESLYGLYSDVLVTVGGYEDIIWSELDLEGIQQQIKGFQDKCKRLPKAMREWEAYLELKTKIDDFDRLLPLLADLSHPAILSRHWEAISEVTGTKFKVDMDTFKLKNLLEATLLENEAEVHDICFAAVREAEIETKINALQDEWSDASFEFANFKKRGAIILNGERTQEIMSQIEDSLMVLAGLLSSPYNKPFKADILLWSQKLSTCFREIENWVHVQSLWIYLEAVFVGGDIAKAMPLEAKRFASIDKSWVKIMNAVRDNPNVVSFVYSDETLSSLLPHLADMLELCRSSLAGYLEGKQRIFPRFYFLSHPALLEVLGSANSNCQAVQPHLKSVFANIHRVKFSKTEFNHIVGMTSGEGEYVPLRKSMECEGNVENWLNVLISRMKETVRSILRRGASVMGSMDLDAFVMEHAAQVGLLGIQLKWTETCEKSLGEAAKGDQNAMKARDFANYNDFMTLVTLTREDLDRRDRVKVETLVTISYHQWDIFNELFKAYVRSPEDFDWLKQTRFYWRGADANCKIHITDVEFEYCYEYLGCTDRLVITPLTDRCYITLAQAMGMSLGGAPAGPAGTGKTETVKDMGKALGKYVVVFNCSPEMTYQQLEKTFKGLAMSGCWGDFDEFNRIKLPVLSVAAQQISSIFTAKRDQLDRFVFTDGALTPLDTECCIFITMNPGYAGRQELPENLKLQFRTCAMMVPDRDIIMKVKLAASGFQKFLSLAIKFFWLYKLCEEQLSEQIHYDFGLRNILSVLRTAGAVKRAHPDDMEDDILQRVCRSMNLSKLVDDDYQLFLSLLSDLFPGEFAVQHGAKDLDMCIDSQCESLGLIPHPSWKLKLFQLEETAKVRHGIMVLGPSGAGKTTCISVLLGALKETGLSYREWRMNPKAIKTQQYLGKTETATNEWKDGIFSSLWRKANKMLEKKKDEHVWLTMDGPVDSLWIESLNTVLDDNKTLTLPNGDRLPMHRNLKLIFEVDSLDNASPATVSRCGMIYMSDTALGWRPVLASWLKSRADYEVEVLHELFEAVWDAGQLFVSESLNVTMVTPLINAIQMALNLLTSSLKRPSTAAAPSAVHLNRLFVFAFVWALGGLLSEEERVKFSAHLYENDAFATLDLPDIGAFRDAADGDTIFEFMVPEFEYPEVGDVRFHDILVPTTDSARLEFLTNEIMKQGLHVLLVGESGTAKTVTILQYMAKQDPDKYLSKVVNFSYATETDGFQSAIEGSVQKVHTGVFAPQYGKKMMVFVDDISMPETNEWGDQPTNETVRQLIEEQGLYSLEKPGEFLKIIDLQFLGAMFHPGGGRNDIPSRLKRHFAAFNCTLPSPASIERIFSVIVQGHYSYERGFSGEVVELAGQMTSLTTRIWSLTKARMLPTPEHFHYVFNLRDLSRITEGLIDTQSDVVTSRSVLLTLWRHECERVLSDRLISSEHRKWFAATITSVVSEAFGAQVAAEVMSPCFFVDFLRDEPDIDEIDLDDPNANFDAPKVYEPIKSMKALRSRIKGFMDQHNEEVRGFVLDLVLFEDCIKHVVKISRIIRRPRGCALLVGVGGSGKQSVTKLAAYIAGHETFQLQMTRSYNVSKLMEDLQVLYRKAGGEGKKVTFIFTDNDIKEERFLEYINSILTSGDVDVMAKDERDSILLELREVMNKERPELEDNMVNLNKFFIERVRQNLHIVLCFSPVGEKFRTRSLKFPGLVSGVTIDWFDPWPLKALKAVSRRYLVEFPMVCEASVREALIEYMSNVHFLVERTSKRYFEKYRRNVFVTPKSYLSFLSSFRAVYEQKKAEIDAEDSRMKIGLQKLEAAEISVSKLKEKLDEQEVELVKAQEVARQQLDKIVTKTAEAKKEKDKVKAVKDQVLVQQQEAEAASQAADAELAKALPHLKAAIAALEVIDPKDINELRAGNHPVHFTKRVLDCVRIMRYLGMEPVEMEENGKIRTSWVESKRMMNKKDFLDSLLNFPLTTLNGEIIELLEPYFDDEEFMVGSDRAATVNLALKGLFEWCEAIIKYYHVSRDIEPKQMAKNKAQKRLQQANEELSDAQKQLDEKEAVLAAMQAKYDACQAEEQRLASIAEKTKRTMTAALALIDGLAGEKERWTAKSLTFGDVVTKLVGDVAVATAFLSYAGPFMQEYRNRLVKQCRSDLKSSHIPFSSELDVVKLLTDDNEVGQWNLEGLPTDGQSTQNGIIVVNAAHMYARFPLMIDPQGQGRAWILNHEAANGLKVVTFDTRGFKDTLETCVQTGVPLLIEDVGNELDPILDPVLERGVKLPGAKHYICKIGDKEVNYAEGFRLYMTTKIANPKYSPEVCAKTALVDFTVTRSGLEDQLLGRVIRHEQEYLETKRAALLEELNTNKQLIKSLEDNLLAKLSQTEGNLVDDTELINVLRKSKTTSEEVKEKIVSSVENERIINQAREQYRPVATRGSILYFIVSEMAMVDHMYETSLAQFLNVFDESMVRAAQTQLAAQRISNIIEELTYSTFTFMTRGLFEEHKLLFLLQCALKIDLEAREIDGLEYRTFVKGGASLDPKTGKANPDPSDIPEDVWLNLRALHEIPIFHNILEQIENNVAGWKAWYNKAEPEKEVIPDGYNEMLNPFQRLLLVRCWCVDRMYFAAEPYIAKTLGEQYTAPPQLGVASALEDSDPLTPVVCLLSIGSDPSEQIRQLSKKLYRRVPLEVSMGAGQEVVARKHIATGMASGQWVLLQNCHLGVDFMDEVVAILTAATEAKERASEAYAKGSGGGDGDDDDDDDEGSSGGGLGAKEAGPVVHDDFRLWMTTSPTTEFPILLLHRGIKVTNEPPQGVRAGLQKTFADVSQDELEYVDRPEYRSLLYSITWLHSIVQERRKFGPLGWNIPYEFNSADLAASLAFLRKYMYDLDPKANVDWKTVRYIITEVHYGGRVTDDFDRRLLKSYGTKWLSNAVANSGASGVHYEFAPGYCVPPDKSLEGIKEYLLSLPATDSPLVFGLHPTAEIAYRRAQSLAVLSTILAIQPKDSTSGDKPREVVVDEMCAKFLEQLRPDFIESQVRAKIDAQSAQAAQAAEEAGEASGADKAPPPLNIFLFQEVQRMQIVLNLVRTSLTDLRLAIAGTIVLSERLMDILSAIYDGRVPEEWARVSWKSTTLSFWMAALDSRYTQYEDWLNKGRPLKVKMGLLFNPQGFLTAVLQEASRKMGLPLDMVDSYTTIPKDGKEIKRTEMGVYLEGLTLEGARWDRRNGKLEDLGDRGKQTMVEMPCIFFSARPKEERDLTQYACPVYVSPRRQDLEYVTTIWLKTDHEEGPGFWVRRGVALLTTRN
ncbi:dynein heavy chain 5 [Thecamonas trahens ATCC 50062]|uniref:Dynein heavy chain 5 n=1 Tax=Thecamonas trahens ATCC 50062 TaxID=461836 RepID=A0A0L0DAV0_THETB|nr:dynein heavy chain 5 [Thecamonas trahens ATCC 50062]KNC49484.1 dynein heavy chain 5 [Thecamonas trahens ATCC 50062]|eukprot:XP_013757903.1 dynein heavy chain 5 [Thecamonas trahens ATCC 50062]